MSEAAAPAHVVVAGWRRATVRFAGSVMPKLDCVSAKPLAFDSMTVSVDGELVAVVAGENDALTVGAVRMPR